MGDGTLRRVGAQRFRHPQRPERLGCGNGQSEVYFGLAFVGHPVERGDGGGGEGAAGGGVLRAAKKPPPPSKNENMKKQNAKRIT